MKTTHVYVLSLLCIIPLFSLGQGDPKKFHIELVELLYDEDLQFQFMEEIPINLRVVYRRDSDGKRKVKILRSTNQIKKQLSIVSKQGRYHNGELYYRKKDVWRNGGYIDIHIRDKLESGFSKKFQLYVPSLEAISMSYDNRQVGPGKKIPIELTLHYEGGFQRSIYPALRDIHIRERSFPKVEDVRVRSDELVILERKKGALRLFGPLVEPGTRNKQLYLIPGLNCPEEILLEAELVQYPGIVGALSIPMTYNASYSYNFNGRYGANGSRDALPVDIYVKKIQHRDRELVWIKVQNAHQTEETLFDPQLGAVHISCRGRRGMDGTDGMDGSDSSTDPPGSGCDGGNGGDGDDGGDGAFVTIHVDQESEEILHLISIDNAGGIGGQGGRGGTGGAGNPSGSNGRNGLDGRHGRNGPLPQTILVPSEVLEDMINLTKTPKEQ